MLILIFSKAFFLALPQFTSEIYNRPARRRIKFDSNSCIRLSDNITSHKVSIKINFLLSANVLFIFEVKKYSDFGSSLFTIVSFNTCSTDCGSCCGDGSCNFGETCDTCSTDCGECQSINDCVIQSSSPDTGYVEVLKVSGDSNAHAGIVGQSTYSNGRRGLALGVSKRKGA